MPHTRESFSSSILQVERSYWQERYKVLAAELASAAEKLDALTHTQECDSELIPTLHIQLEWLHYESDIYVGGYVRDPRYAAKTYKITTNNLDAVWLGLLARQQKPIEEVLRVQTDPQMLIVNLRKIIVDDMSYSVRPVIAEQFEAAKEATLTQLPSILEEAKNLFAYKDITPTIDSSVLDYLTRKLMLEKCLEIDPDFSIS